MKPCPADKLPGYTEDPVDGSSAGVLANTEINQCYNKNEYMGGKYSDTGNFCPIAWVYRLGQTKENIMTDLTDPIMELETKNGENIYLEKAKDIAKKEADEIYVESKKLLENVDMPTGPMLSACTKLHTPERVHKAYNICKKIHDDPSYVESILQDKTQQQVLIQACNSLFCNNEDDLVSTISPGTDALCFKNIHSINNKELLKNDRMIEKGQSSEIDSEPPPNIKEPKNVDNGFNYAKWSSYTGIFIIVGIPVIMILLFVLYKLGKWLWENVLRHIKSTLWCYTLYILDLISLKDNSHAKGRLQMCKIQSKIVPQSQS
jgi:hypothetical protein